MAIFRLSRRAKSDLLEIARYTLDTWGADQASNYIDEFETACQQLADNPRLGRACAYVRPGLRRMEHEKHVVFYRIESEGILVVRILHQRMLPKEWISLK